jgi:hypothetical protein
VTGRRLIGAVAALVVAAALAGCQSPVESPAALLVTSGGSVLRLDDACALGPVTGAPGNIRHLAVAGRTIVVISEAGQVSVARASGLTADGLTWRHLDVDLPDDGFTAGIDVSSDGRSLALVQAHDDAERLELAVIDLANGDATMRKLDQPANGPPSWLSNDEIALEVVDRDGQAQVVKVAADDHDAAPVASGSRGFALAATPDGRTLAVADDSAHGVVVADRAQWWLGERAGSLVEPPSPDLAVQDVAIDADGTRLAVVYARGDSSTWTLVVSRFADGRWERAASIDLESETPPTIDWLE